MIQEINSIMKILFKHTRLFTFLLPLLLLCGVANHAWAYKVTYHILTLPINNSIYHMSTTLNEKRLEAVRVVDNNATTVNLPDAYKSPLAENFTYYLDNETNIEKHDAVGMYDWGDKDMTCYYEMKEGATPINTAEYTVSSNIDVYVTYDYNPDNGIVKLDGSEEYNLTMSSGFWGFNRGRNNRIAVFKEDLKLVNNDALVNEDFTQFEYTKDNKIPNTNISAYWNNTNDNKNPKEAVAGQFHFIYKFEGSDPYNILIATAYNKNYTYLEKHGTENSQRYKWYKGSHLFRPSSDGTGFFMSSDDHKEYTETGSYSSAERDVLPYTERSGYFKSKGKSDKNLNYSTFALLNNSNTPSDGYVFMVSRFVNTSGDLSTPDDYKKASYNYLTRDGNFNNLKYENLTLANATKSYSTDPKIYRVQNYVYKVTKKVSGAKLAEKMRVSEYFLGEDPINFIPESLRRKYVTYKAYSDAGMTSEVTTFTEAATKCVDDLGDDFEGCKVIYLDYETNMPFETSATSATYGDLKWYNLQADKNSRYVTFLSGSDFNTYQNHSRNGYDSHFAFIGDPYDLQIVSRKATENNSRELRYLAFTTGEEDAWKGNITYSATATVWEMKYDDNTGDYAGCFRLNESGNTDKNLYWNFGSGSYPLIGSATTAVRLTVVNLPTINYNYYIMRNDGDNSIAVMTQAFQEPGVKLDYDHIPEVIRSPFLEDVKETITFYGGFTGDDAEEEAIASAKALTDEIDYAPDTGGSGDLQHIVIRYNFDGSSHKDDISGDSEAEGAESKATFNVRLNGQYIYYDSSSGTIMSSATIENNDDGKYNWILGGSDPYTLNIKSKKAKKFITIDGALPTGDEAGVGKEISWSDGVPSLKYIIKLSSKEEGQTYYEVMAATGKDLNALDETFNFGRPADNTVKMYSDWSYLRGSDVLRFELIKNSAVDVTYHLIDKTDHVLLSVQTRQDPDATPSFPAEYRSPLVGKYHYWISSNFNIDIVSGKYTLLNESQTELNKISSVVEDGGGVRNIYVTYDANDLVDMTGRTMYLMKYALGDTFKQEDGSDGVSTTAQKAVYPYCNGDCNFFVYGQEQYDIQQQSAASTRTRWAWYVESVNNDPYHVKIRSRQQETYPAGSKNNYNAYFRTYKPNGYSEVVTTLAWPGISGEQGTEYMVLGSAGQFRLVTTYGIDLNNDGDRSDTGEDVRRAVNSFEQYWKTWNTIRLNVLGDKDAVAKQSDPNTVPATPAAPTAAAAGMDNRAYLSAPNKMGWHSYEQWAYAIRWNDYNKAGDKNKKGWESIEHWYQTVKMGEGYFDFVPTTIDPVLILLDQHGWEVMRKPLPSSPTDPDKTAKYDAIRPYDSPMVKEYHFWTKTSKRSGFHQYHTLSQRVTVDGEPFTSTSLTSLPPFDATNVHDAKGNLYDQYVTYTVKDEYVKACNVSLSYTDDVVDPADSKKTYSKVTATVTGVPFLIQQGNHFVSATGETTLKNDNAVPATGGMSQYIITNASNLTISGSLNYQLWYLMPNLNIDNEMGYDVTAIPAHNWASDYDRKDKVQTSGFNSWAFDPYNIQISSVAHSSSYFVTSATTAEVHEGSILGDGTSNSLGARKAVDAALVGGWDNRTIRMTNATFMAVQDKNGNMQLMPRFDQEKRLKDFSTLVHTDDPQVAQTYTTLYRPLVYNYHIIDNSGQEALRYQGGGDLVPQTPDWFKSPLAKDYKYYFGHAAYTESTSSKASYDAAASSNYFQKTADSESAMKTAANALTVLDDYYFKVTNYNYVKVTVTAAKTEETDAVYTVTPCSKSDYDSSTGGTKIEGPVADDAALQTAAKALTSTGAYYYMVGPLYNYKKVTVTKAHSGSTYATYTTANCTEADWTNAVVKSRTEVANQAAMRTAVDAQTVAGTYYYKLTSPSETYMKVVVKSGSSNFPVDVAAKKDISDKEITGSLAGADLDATSSSNDVYVRYSYDEEVDNMGILKGKWLTMTLNAKNAVYSDGVKQASVSKPDPVNASHKDWQWKFLANSQTTPDPYAVSMYNRNNTTPTPGTATAVNENTKFALLNWYNGTSVDASAYTLAVHGLGTVDNYDYTYQFVNGASMGASTAATTDTEANVKSTSCSYTSTNAKIVLTDDVNHAYTYKIYTNGTNGSYEVKYGILAVSATQDQTTASENDYVPTLPDEIKSPLLNMDQFKYYEAEADMGSSAKELKSLYGMYGDDIYVRYTAYDKAKTEYKVPNVRNATSEPIVARGEGSNDAALDISGNLLYNVIWYNDNMMRSTDNTNITGPEDSQPLHSEDAYVWKFEGDDPYAIKIKHKNANKYIYNSSSTNCTLDDTNFTSFMLLPSTDSSWEYGMLQVTGGTNKLCGYGATVAADPTKFIIFSLSTHKIIYHLVIANIGSSETIPYSASNVPLDKRYNSDNENELVIQGSTNRDLTTGSGATYQLGETWTINGNTKNYCVNQGQVTLGDPFKVPEALERPNCKYFYYIEGIYNNSNDGTKSCTTPNPELNTAYKGLNITQMPQDDDDLLNKTVVINVEYQFDDGLPTNNGSDFVTNTSGTQWFTFETNDVTPYLANFTYKDNIMKGKKGRIGHYTNEFLWSPVGDPYGFKMYNRYVYKNGTETGHADKVMTTTSAPDAGADLIMAVDASLSKPVYELLPGETAGYFKVQTLTIPESETPYYIDNSSGVITLKASTKTEWTFGLSDALLEPYYLGAGNVGGLTTTVKEGTSKTKSGKTLYEEATTLMAKQEVVFDADNIVDFTPGYYRIFNQPNSQGITIPRYLSGYTHKTELTGDGENTYGPIPMHFYEKKGVNTTFDALGATGYTKSHATQGQIPIEAPEYDPASIFYITGTASAATMSTQGLNVIENKMGTTTGTTFHIIDIGGAVVLLHDGYAIPDERKYLHYKQTENIYDVKYEVVTDFNDDDAAKWCMEPANKLGLYIATHSGGEEEVLTTTWYYSTYCVPFDLLIANKNDDEAHSSNAYTCLATWKGQPESPWPGTAEEARKGLHPKPIGKYNEEPYQDNDYFVPAGTPVIFSTKRATEYIKATIPTNSPSTSIPTIFSAKYLEQKLPDWNNANRVYVFGPKMEGTMNINTSNGDVTATLPSLGNTNVGFHLNANPNKETGLMPASWTRNNYYVLHNRIYYIANVTPSAEAKAAEFVPFIFDFDEDMEEEEEMKAKPQTVDVSDDKVYDVQGRCIAIGEDVLDGSWRNNVAPGLYIIGGKKVYVGK